MTNNPLIARALDLYSRQVPPWLPLSSLPRIPVRASKTLFECAARKVCEREDALQALLSRRDDLPDSVRYLTKDVLEQVLREAYAEFGGYVVRELGVIIPW